MKKVTAKGTNHLEGRQSVESCGVNCFWGDVGDVCYEFLQIPAGLLQVGGINDDLYQLQRQGYSSSLSPECFSRLCVCEQF